MKLSRDFDFFGLGTGLWGRGCRRGLQTGLQLGQGVCSWPELETSHIGGISAHEDQVTSSHPRLWGHKFIAWFLREHTDLSREGRRHDR